MWNQTAGGCMIMGSSCRPMQQVGRARSTGAPCLPCSLRWPGASLAAFPGLIQQRAQHGKRGAGAEWHGSAVRTQGIKGSSKQCEMQAVEGMKVLCYELMEATAGRASPSTLGNCAAQADGLVKELTAKVHQVSTPAGPCCVLLAKGSAEQHAQHFLFGGKACLPPTTGSIFTVFLHSRNPAGWRCAGSHRKLLPQHVALLRALHCLDQCGWVPHCH